MLADLAAGVLIAMLAACGAPATALPPPPAGPTPTVTVPIEMPLVISLVGSFDEQTLTVLVGQIAAFEAANPDLRVELVKASTDDEERRQAFAGSLAQGDTSRDIYLVDYTWLASFATQGWLLPLDNYLQAEELTPDQFLPPAVQASTIDGRLLALPWSVDAGLLYYRQDLLDAAPQTWPELAITAAQLTGPEGTPYGFVWQGAAYETLTCTTLEFVWAFGGQVLDAGGQPVFDSPQTRAALQQMAELGYGGLAPTEVAVYREAEALDAFARGEAAMMRHWFSAWDRLNAPGGSLAGKVAIAPLPATCLGAQSLALSASSFQPDQAFRFMAFLASHEQQVQLGREGPRAPARASAYRDEELLEERPILRLFHDAVVRARPRPQSPLYPDISEAIYSEVNALLRGEQDAAATAAAVQARIEALLDMP